MEKVKVLIVRFSNEITREEIPLFRGAIVNATENADLLFHNHDEGGRLRYSYPLIQYKRINQKAAIVCLGEGTDVVGQFFSSCNFDVLLGERSVKLEVESVNAHQYLIQLWDGEFTYRIRRWLPLNRDNYAAYCQEESLAVRYAMLERLLAANILSFAKGVGVHFDGQVVARITQMDEPRLQYYKGIKLMSFDAEFKTNVSLPDYIGLGKGVSLGMGMVVRKYGEELVRPPKKEKIFLLGGHDLEMMTIKDMLLNQDDCEVLDRNLRWDNALLSAYKDELTRLEEVDVYGIELQEDIELPKGLKSRYHRIDHHNELQVLPSSLEQVVAVLGVGMDRRLQLIAANDKGYIPAMQALHASMNEILEIRRLDRVAQGVTEEEERLADESVSERLTRYDNLLVVEAMTSNFSPICDRLYPYKRLLIYTQDEWMFFGEGKEMLTGVFANHIAAKRVFHGGGTIGYIGTVKGAFSNEEKNQMVEQIINIYEHA